MPRTVRFATTVTPLEAEYIRRLARKAHRTPAGWVYLALRERLLEEYKNLNPKEKSRGANPGSASDPPDVLPADRLDGPA